MEIKQKVTGKVLKTVHAPDLTGADLTGAKGGFYFNHGVKLKVVTENECEYE